MCRQELHTDIGTPPGSESPCPPREQGSTAQHTGVGAELPGLHSTGLDDLEQAFTSCCCCCCSGPSNLHTLPLHNLIFLGKLRTTPRNLQGWKRIFFIA